MKNFIGYCGLDCEKCEARIATITNDDKLRDIIAKKWSKLNNVEITKEMINCVGCREKGPKTPFCDYMCEIKKCASNNKYKTCANCQGMDHCTKLNEITANSPEALSNLKIKQ